ncbi:ATP-binding protein [Rhodospira trueperi]|uniref:Histidine kinase-like ATPase domain-containing protein n=1 Tax=Rhodospira trueperi TaxID=69960 RepID=A0A1G7BJ64_9PROT|nr:ATP-binding protein [Rhodospira trueperi]SDE26760.1 Histidine kinase-like ATPase domain-containing protein [Rhodospira trueperi]
MIESTHRPTDRNAPEILTRFEVRNGGDGLLQRVLAPPNFGVMTIEATESAPELMETARRATEQGGYVVLLTAASAWRLDLANTLIEAAVRRWPDLLERRDRLRLALHEAVVNALLHGCLRVPPHLRDTPEGWLKHSQEIEAALADPERGSRPVLVTLVAGSDGWVAQVVDQGPGFAAPRDPTSDAVIPAALHVPTRGRGLAMMRAACDRVVWLDGGRRVELTMPYPPEREG